MKRRMKPGWLTGWYGVVIISLFIVLLIVCLCFSLYFYISRRRLIRNEQHTPHKYTIVDHSRGDVLKVQQNQIQPPSQDKTKIGVSEKTLTRSFSPTRKKTLRYCEIDMDENTFEQEGDTQSSFRKSIRGYIQKIVELLNKRTSKVSDEEIFRPRIVSIGDTRNAMWTTFRLRRANSSYSGDSTLGQILFMLQYSSLDEFLTVNLLSGRRIHSSDPEYTAKLPVVSIQIEGYPDTEVTSSPDEAPNPDYDQEFTFDSINDETLFNTILRFTIWDIVSNHETRVIGFIHVNLAHFHKTLVETGESGPIRREISEYLSKDKIFNSGQILLTLMYDCVTDRIRASISMLRDIAVNEDDVDIYIEMSLLLDDGIIQSKRSTHFTSAVNINVDQTFEFNTLSADLELLTNTSEFSKASLEIRDTQLEKGSSSETLRNNMGILCSVCSTTVSNTKRLIGCLKVGRSNFAASRDARKWKNIGKKKEWMNDETFHWEEMIRHFDNAITQWHVIR